MSTKRAAKLVRRARRKEKKRKACAPYQPGVFGPPQLLSTPEAIAAAREEAYQNGGVFFNPDGTIEVIEVLK